LVSLLTKCEQILAVSSYAAVSTKRVNRENTIATNAVFLLQENVEAMRHYRDARRRQFATKCRQLPIV